MCLRGWDIGIGLRAHGGRKAYLSQPCLSGSRQTDRQSPRLEPRPSSRQLGAKEDYSPSPDTGPTLLFPRSSGSCISVNVQCAGKGTGGTDAIAVSESKCWVLGDGLAGNWSNPHRSLKRKVMICWECPPLPWGFLTDGLRKSELNYR